MAKRKGSSKNKGVGSQNTPSKSSSQSGLMAQAKALQSSLNSSVSSGQIPGRVINGRAYNPLPSETPNTPNTTTPPQSPTPYTPSTYTPQSGKGYTPYTPGASASAPYFQQLQASLTPSQAETDIEGQQTALESSMRNLNQGQGVMNQNLADQPIALGFIAGQQKAVENRYALQRGDVQNQQQTLQAKLANLQSRRQSAMDVARSGMEYGQSQDSRQDNLAQQNFANQSSQNEFNANQTQQGYQNWLNTNQFNAGQTQQQHENSTNATQYKNSQEQQQYENTTNASRYGDSQTQQGVENRLNQQQLAIQQQNANTASRGSSSSSTDTSGLSDDAQNILNQVNLGANLDDLVKGTSNAAQKLRNEVLRGLNSQGGRSEKDVAFLKEAKTIADKMITSKAYNAVGGYSTILGQYGTAYGDAKAQAGQLQSMLARDNLGLLKGAMSDKDLAFILSMSSGFAGEGRQSDAYIKSRLEDIQAKIGSKIASAESGGSQGGGNQPKVMTLPDGKTLTLQADGTYE